MFKVGDKVLLAGRKGGSIIHLAKHESEVNDSPLRINGIIHGVDAQDLDLKYLVEVEKSDTAIYTGANGGMRSKYNCDPDRLYVWANEKALFLQGRKEVLVCKECKTPNEYALPNQPDGTYICYAHPR